MYKSNYSSQRSPSRSSRPSSVQHYPRFYVQSSDYELVFINNDTSTNTMNKLLNHVNKRKLYSIDTELE